MAFMRNHTHHSISDFRKQNPSGLKIVQTLFLFFKDADLIDVKSSLLMEPKQSAQQQES
jgi:hypothetical protein